MEHKTKKELFSQIEENNKIIQVYKIRLHDVIKSYKEVTKEKETLEEIVKILTDVNTLKTSDHGTVESGESIPMDNIPNAGLKNETQEDAKSLQTLKASLGMLVTEKAKVESELKADRKKLLQEKEQISKEWNEKASNWEEEKKSLQSELQEMKKRIREHQRDREKEQQDHAIMLKELQSLLADERSKKEQLEQQRDDLKSSLEKLKTPDRKSSEYEKCINELNKELTTMKDRLQYSEETAKKPSPLFFQLQDEMSEIKIHHHLAIEQEKKRANEAEDKLNSLAANSEERVASLEAHLSELSQMVGNYDRLRQQDLVSIQKLKERVTQLDTENSALARTIAGDQGKPWEVDEDINLDVQTLMERIIKLKNCLRLANQRSEKQINITGFLNEIEEKDSDLHAKCQDDLHQLKEEFERYKLRAQSVLKNKIYKDTEVTEEINKLKSQVATYQDQLQICKSQMEMSDEQHAKTISNLQRSINEIKYNHKLEVSSQEYEYKAKILELEQQIQKQRQRTVTLLEEKDKEISLLKSTALLSVTRKDNSSVKNAGNEAKCGKHFETSLCEEDYLADMLSCSVMSSKNEARLLYYAQEMALKDVEIMNLRSARLEAESALRELQQIALVKEEKYVDEIDTLKSQVRRFESGHSNEGINMEYLKNVVLRFIMCQDTSDKVHMLNAITTVLHFTPREIQQVKASNPSWT